MDQVFQSAPAIIGIAHVADLLHAPVAAINDLTNLIFFQRIHEFLIDEIDEFRENLLGRTMAWVSGVALMAMTVWILIQGFRIVTGQSRDSMMVFATQSVRNAFILSAAMTMAVFGTDLEGWFSEGMVSEIHQTVTGNSDDPYESIDESLGYMQLAMSSIDAIHVGGDEIINEAKTRAQWFSGIGIAGPAIVGGSMLLLYRIAMALFIGLGPIFIACLLFDSTKPLFHKWLLYGIGTMFSLAVLSVMVSLALDVVIAVAGSFWAGKFLGTNMEGVTSTALQQGGLGLILTMLIVSAPPIAANFFQATLANFSAYNQFASNNTTTPSGQPQMGYPQYSNPGGQVPSGNQSQGGGSNRNQQAPSQAGYNNPAVNQNYGNTQVDKDTVKPRKTD